MAQHGYLGDNHDSRYDPDYDERDDARGWRGDRDWGRDRNRSFLFEDRGREQSRYRPREQNEEPGFFSRVASEARSWFDDDDDDRRRSLSSERRGPRSHPDDHYISWRAKQLEALDRDYEDYCREREQQFHQDFESWRSNRQSSSGRVAGDSGELILGADQQAGTSEPAQETINPAKPSGGRSRS